jgi:hypothetical protein
MDPASQCWETLARDAFNWLNRIGTNYLSFSPEAYDYLVAQGDWVEQSFVDSAPARGGTFVLSNFPPAVGSAFELEMMYLESQGAIDLGSLAVGQ